MANEYLTVEILYGTEKWYGPSQKEILKSVKATKEVIVSGGAFNSLQILKLSGIGLWDKLETIGIPIYADNYVAASAFKLQPIKGPSPQFEEGGEGDLVALTEAIEFATGALNMTGERYTLVTRR
ncbi:hypothetical protein F4860DRAFT_520685 [Xylaria cubensis]|nr:hypothetical protein F4860DRAFT_520685 [Xylaria cubensis]